ncbi:MAG TPA: hypothetical protein VGW76_07085 [Pyrinomonadaceae bacterium]|nr:hypothetical protein [Pyrinomonadaceae bacterium]
MIAKFATLLIYFELVIVLSSVAHAQQIADPHFDASVQNPAFTKNFPRVLFDEAHNNNDLSHGRYKPFADLLFNDGYKVVVNRQPFTKATLINFKVLVIVNPLGAEDLDDENADAPAFTTAECDAVNDWIRDGGALLFIVDAEAFASAAEVLATRLGVDMSKRNTIDPANGEKELNPPGVIVYSRQNHLLGEHSITNGRNETERVNRVMVFGGQSLKGPSGTDALMKLADTAEDTAPSPGKNSSAAGRAQAIAFRLGKGRVVMLSDAAMLSAQLSGSDSKPFGMNVPDTDNRQLALNTMHWLSGLLK